MKPLYEEIFTDYAKLLAEVDGWYARCKTAYPKEILCREGCAECCRSLFDITLVDAWFLRLGFARLSESVKRAVIDKAEQRLKGLQNSWPELAPPYLLNHRKEEEWTLLMPEDDETPCVLLGEDGRCLVYDNRPMTCRLHGLPLLDEDGTVLHDEWCTINFPNCSPLALDDLRAEFTRMFREEVALFRKLESMICKKGFKELDTFIPLALLVDYEVFDWEAWVRGKSPMTIDQVEIND